MRARWCGSPQNGHWSLYWKVGNRFDSSKGPRWLCLKLAHRLYIPTDKLTSNQITSLVEKSRSSHIGVHWRRYVWPSRTRHELPPWPRSILDLHGYIQEPRHQNEAPEKEGKSALDGHRHANLQDGIHTVDWRLHWFKKSSDSSEFTFRHRLFSRNTRLSFKSRK